MGTTAISGPFLVYGENIIEQNDDIAPSNFARGQGFVDDRAPFLYDGTSNVFPKVRGFPQQQWVQTLNATIYPIVLLASSLPLVDVMPGVPIPLITSPVPGATPGVTVRESGTGRLIRNVLMIDDCNFALYNGEFIATTASTFHASDEKFIEDALAFTTSFAAPENIACWDPSKLSARRITLGGGGNPNEFFITGIDAYGYLISDTITTEVVGGSFVYSRKAFKGIISIIPTTVDSSPQQTQFFTTPDVGLPLRYDYPYAVMAYNAGVLDVTPSNFESSLYTITGITPLAGILTITIAPSETSIPSVGQPYTLPVGSHVTISRCVPSSYNGTYTILTSGPGTFTVSSTNVDVYVSGGFIFCDQGGFETADVRGIYASQPPSSDPFNLIVYQTVTLQNMQDSVGQFGIPQFSQ